MSVREIRGWTPATAMPHSPAYMKGVINLRGAVLPIIDLSARLGMKPTVPTVRHVIIVSAGQPQGRRPAGRCGVRYPDCRKTTYPAHAGYASEMQRQFARGILAIESG
jgi:purine-binding chemotaxis protein CheW